MCNPYNQSWAVSLRTMTWQWFRIILFIRPRRITNTEVYNKCNSVALSSTGFKFTLPCTHSDYFIRFLLLSTFLFFTFSNRICRMLAFCYCCCSCCCGRLLFTPSKAMSSDAMIPHWFEESQSGYVRLTSCVVLSSSNKIRLPVISCREKRGRKDLVTSSVLFYF